MRTNVPGFIRPPKGKIIVPAGTKIRIVHMGIHHERFTVGSLIEERIRTKTLKLAAMILSSNGVTERGFCCTKTGLKPGGWAMFGPFEGLNVYPTLALGCVTPAGDGRYRVLFGCNSRGKIAFVDWTPGEEEGWYD